MSKEATYSISAMCNNCQAGSLQIIPKGVTVMRHLNSKTCDVCGCAELYFDREATEEQRRAINSFTPNWGKFAQ